MARTADNVLVPTFGVYGAQSAPTFAADLTEIADDAAQVAAAQVVAVTDLPASGDYLGQRIWVQEAGENRWWDGTAWQAAVPEQDFLTAGFYQPAPGWSMMTTNVLRTSLMIGTYLSFKRTGGTINVPSHGDIPNTLVCTFNQGFRPRFDGVLSSGNSGRVANGFIASSGQVQIASVGGSGNITNDDTLSLGGVFLR